MVNVPTVITAGERDGDVLKKFEDNVGSSSSTEAIT
jgi:hypothetical protein